MDKSNRANVVKKIIIRTDIETFSPLRIGSGRTDGVTDILILKNKQGKAFIPATSLTGVLRSLFSDIYAEDAAKKLFGSIDDDGNQSMINISDIVFDEKSADSEERIIHRDGVKIDHISGVAEKGAKYDFEALDRGAKGRLSIEITVRRHDLDTSPAISIKHKNIQDAYGELACIIADMLAGGIQVGSLTTKGYGEIKSPEAKCYEFDFEQPDSADGWLAYIEDGGLKEDNCIYTAKENDAKDIEIGAREMAITAGFTMQSSLIVRDQDKSFFASDKESNVAGIQMESGGDYVIPGTSIKGVIQNKAFDILMALTGNDEKKTDEYLKNIMGFASSKESDGDVETSGKKSCLYVKDIYIKKENVNLINQTRNRIDRFTGGTIDGALFSEYPIITNKKDEFYKKPYVIMNLRLKDCDKAQAGLMMLILRDFWTGSLPLGGGKSIGRGVLKGKSCCIRYKDENRQEHVFKLNQKDKLIIDGDKDLLQSYVDKLAGECND